MREKREEIAYCNASYKDKANKSCLFPLTAKNGTVCRQFFIFINVFYRTTTSQL